MYGERVATVLVFMMTQGENNSENNINYLALIKCQSNLFNPINFSRLETIAVPFMTKL